ncbi:MAG: aminodeoxychorismate synthase component I [Saprospiraceae bacterium]|nr:aminodeoxychorismate synthase component I [Saprospiraceae bacterium]
MDDYYQRRIPFLFVIDYQKTQGLCLPLSEINPEEIQYSFGQSKQSSKSSTKLAIEVHPESYESYRDKFNCVKEQLKLGNTYLCNLTQPSKIKINWGLQEIYEHSHASYKLYLKDRFVIFSPETFVNIEDGKISTYPMKGTADAEKEGSYEFLQTDLKENAEHNTIVDLLRNDLSIVANRVQVKKLKYIEKIKTHKGELWQMSSEITGILRESHVRHPGKIFDDLLPAGSISGAPKAKTLQIIEEVEKYKRGYYTGVFGLFDGSTLKSAVMIRFIEKSGDQFIYKSGGGITALSDPQLEYQELLDKIYVPVF